MASMAPQNTAHPNARYDDKLNWNFPRKKQRPQNYYLPINANCLGCFEGSNEFKTAITEFLSSSYTSVFVLGQTWMIKKMLHQAKRVQFLSC